KVPVAMPKATIKSRRARVEFARAASSTAVAAASSTPVIRRRKNRNLKMRNEIHMKSLSDFFETREHWDALVPFLEQKSSMSLRSLEFVCCKVGPSKARLLDTAGASASPASTTLQELI